MRLKKPSFSLYFPQSPPLSAQLPAISFSPREGERPREPKYLQPPPSRCNQRNQPPAIPTLNPIHPLILILILISLSIPNTSSSPSPLPPPSPRSSSPPSSPTPRDPSTPSRLIFPGCAAPAALRRTSI